MRISQDIRDYAAAHGVSDDEAIVLGMKEKSTEFVEAGSHIYLAADEPQASTQ
jgi:phosphomethylpyrimidine synthase